jgi:penicillin-binding protein 2
MDLSKSSLYIKRWVSISIILLVFIILIIGFIRLQITNSDMYVLKSLNNSIRKTQVYAVRGLIFDSKGKILVDNRPSFSLAIIPRVAKQEDIKNICDRFNLKYDEVHKKLRKSYGFRPIVVARDINRESVIWLEENRLDLPGIINIIEPKRYYTPDIKSPHIFGYVGEVTQREQKRNSEYEQGDLIGKKGLEKEYDLRLRGSKGVKFVTVDASGRELGKLDINRNVPAVHGDDLQLCLDYEQQAFAESLMTDHNGALVAIDTRTGGILALVSKPDYDPRDLSGKIHSDIWANLLNNNNHPLYDRALQNGYPPGSTFKMVAATAALQEGIITPQWKASCPGYFRLGRKIIHCWNSKGHGTIDLQQAIKYSCNVYFFQLGLKIGLDAWSKYSQLYGFGTRTGIDLPGENKGLVPSITYFNKRYGKNGWTRGNLANLAIGQGELLTTPLQVAQYAMIIANKGTYYTPHLVKQFYNYKTKAFTSYPIHKKKVTEISKDTYEIIRSAMKEVMEGGTGWFGKVPGIEMGGKTGTAENPHGKPHAWFMAFAPYENPEVAISVIIENGGHGGAAAAPIARKFLEKYFFGHLIPRYVPKPDSIKIEENLDSLIIPMDILDIEPLKISPRERE